MGAGVCPWYVWPHGAGSSGTGNLWFMLLQPVSQRLSVWTSPLFPHSNLNHLFLFCRGLKEKLFRSKKGQDNLVHYQTDKSLLYETVGRFSAQVHILSLLHLSTWLQCNWEGDYLKPLPETEYLFLFELLGVILFISGLYLKQEKQVIPWMLQVSKLSVVYCTEQWLLCRDGGGLANSDRTRGDGLKLCQGRLRLDIRNFGIWVFWGRAVTAYSPAQLLGWMRSDFLVGAVNMATRCSQIQKRWLLQAGRPWYNTLLSLFVLYPLVEDVWLPETLLGIFHLRGSAASAFIARKVFISAGWWHELYHFVEN